MREEEFRVNEAYEVRGGGSEGLDLIAGRPG